MIFSSTIFLFGFLPAVLVCYFGYQLFGAKRLRNIILLCFSYLFYLYGAAGFLLILILSTLADYVLGYLIQHNVRLKRLWLSLSLLLNLGLLAYFKYANFFVAEVNSLLAEWQHFPIEWQTIALPIGISFFTFQKLSYVIDVYRGKCPALDNVVDFALYIAMFPQLIAGPIVRFSTIRHQLKSRRESWDSFYNGIIRICWGLAKKVIIANSCGQITDVVFGLKPELLDTKIAWLGALGYTLQIYFDFSAYSDIAIGLGMLFGFTFPENFNRPYSAVSITDFWRRWHMTLSRWFKDYLYIPLGGNRRGTARTCLNMTIVCVLCGLWHGANWTFLFWGMYHGAFLVIERISGLRDLAQNQVRFVRRLATLIIVVVGWVLFRSENISQAIEFLTAMFTYSDLPITYELSRVINYRNILFMLAALPVFFLPADVSPIQLIAHKKDPVPVVAGVIMILLLLPYCAALIVGGASSTFIYYRF
ncbi:MAG: MBOAT family protein [Deltaproteobacteria bacterium]|jgi:alginate O-acetyltransferase complex protein AlgI|nr:MBOAT family protein [Deltaproteobacteria bacterium]